MNCSRSTCSVLGWCAALFQASRRHSHQSSIPADPCEPAGQRPEEFAAYIKAEIAKWERIIRAANIKPQ